LGTLLKKNPNEKKSLKKFEKKNLNEKIFSSKKRLKKNNPNLLSFRSFYRFTNVIIEKENIRSSKRKSNNVNISIKDKKFKKIDEKQTEKGAVLILLNPKFYGKKSILLNKTNDGFLVISGPYCINGISIKKIHPKYSIFTGLKLNLCKYNFRILTDRYFTLLKIAKKNFKKDEKNTLFEAHRTRQIWIDDHLMKEILKDFFLKFYLKARSRLC
jgi:ribosomal protein L14E/L6E/L27E